MSANGWRCSSACESIKCSCFAACLASMDSVNDTVIAVFRAFNDSISAYGIHWWFFCYCVFYVRALLARIKDIEIYGRSSLSDQTSKIVSSWIITDSLLVRSRGRQKTAVSVEQFARSGSVPVVTCRIISVRV